MERTVTLPGGLELELVLIPAGGFMMGSRRSAEEMARVFGMEPGWFASSFPLHRVRITRPFYIGKHELTQAQWRAVTGHNPSHFKDAPDSDRRPVECVSWADVDEAFLPKVQSSAPEGWAFRLPTEAEWEYAARAGSQDYFPWGDTLTPEQANAAFVEPAKQGTAPVGRYAPNAWGLHDVMGNVWEWCRDSWREDFYAHAPADNPVFEDGAITSHVLRGGSWTTRPRTAASHTAAGTTRRKRRRGGGFGW